MENESLVERINAGIDKAENMLILYNQMKGLIHMLARKYSGLAELDDLIQEGYLGLCSAVSHFNSAADVKFSGFAGFCIKRQMQRYIHNNTPLNIPEQMQHLIYQYRQLCSVSLAQSGHYPTDREAALYMQLKEKQIVKIKNAAQQVQPMSLDRPIPDEELTLSDTLRGEEDTEMDVLERIYQEQLKEALWSAVDSLPEHQPEIIQGRYRENMTLQQIADKMGIPRERVRQLENRGIRLLREPEYLEKYESFLDDYIASHAYSRGGLHAFQRTWTSSTERTAIGLLKQCKLDDAKYGGLLKKKALL